MVCFPLNNTEYDAGDMGAFMACRTRGVFSADGNFGVTASGGMEITVEGGVAWLKMEEAWGVVAHEKNPTVLTVEPGHGALNRIDAVYLQLDKTENVARLRVRKGALAATPVLAAPQRNLYYDEIYLATIRVPAGTTQLTQALITDTRLDESLCGLARDGVTGIPTAQLQAQAEDLIHLLERELESVVTGGELMLKAEYAPDATAALSGGRLYITSTYPHIGTRYEVKFIAPADQGTIPVTIDGTNVTVVDMKGSPVSNGWNQGAPVTLSRKGTQAFFKSGGGASAMPTVLGGTTRPQNPAENTIWAYGGWAVGKVFYGASRPKNAAGGDIWLIPGRSNINVTIGGLCFSPTAVAQYQSGEFVPLGASIYTNGRWELFYSKEELQYFSLLAGDAASTVDSATTCAVSTGMSFVTDATAGVVAEGAGTSTTHAVLTSERFKYAKNCTLACAYKTSSAAAERYLMGAGNALENQSVGLMLSAGALRLSGYGSGGYAFGYSNRLTNDGLWHGVAATTDYYATTGHLYLDGDLVASSVFKSYPTLNILNLMTRPGSSPSAASISYSGRMACAFFYSRALDLYEAGTLSRSIQLRAQGVI